MTLIDRILAPFRTPPGPPPMFASQDQRAFVLGSAVVDRHEMAWGHDPTTFSPEEYLRYLATSNGVFACVRLRSQLLSSLTIKFYKVGASGKRTEVTSGKVVELFTKVNPRWTFPRMVEMWESSLCLTGQTYAFLERGKAGRLPPTEMWWGRSDRVRVVPDPDTYISGFLYEPLNGGAVIPYEPGEVFWARYPNPIDEFSGLAPLAAARLAADSAGDAMKSNRNLFINGIQMGGFVLPRQGMPMFTKEQADEASTALSRNAKGVDNAHRWQVFRLDADVKTLTMSPKDAEFLGLLKWSLEDICRAFGVPLDLVGGERTYANQKDARLAIWTDTIIPEARFLDTEITEQILPMFPGEADLAEFDTSDVPALRDYEAQMWSIAKEKIEKGATTINRYLKEKGEDSLPWGDVWWVQTAGGGYAPVNGPAAPIAANQEIDFGGITVNEHRKAKGLPPVAWGDVWWTDAGKKPVDDAEEEVAQGQNPAQKPTTDADGNPIDGTGDGRVDAGRARARRMARTIDYGSPEHERVWTRAVAQTEPWEGRIGDATVGLMRRQRQSIITQLRDTERVSMPDGQRLAAKGLLESVFSLPKWIREFRTTIRGILNEAYASFGQAVLDDVGADQSFDSDHPAVIRAIVRQSQEFANHVNATTFRQLEAALTEGLAANETTAGLISRVDAVMVGRIADASSVVAVTEAGRADTAAGLEASRQSGIVVAKTWMSQYDGRERPTHNIAHGQTVGVDEMFHVGKATGPGPKMMGAIEEDAHCRCFLRWVRDDEVEPRSHANGHHPTVLAELARVVGVGGVG